MSDLERVWVELQDVKSIVAQIAQHLAKGQLKADDLGFGKRPKGSAGRGEALTYVFINQPNNPLTGDTADLWYWRSEQEGVNHGVEDDDLTGFVTSVYWRESVERQTGKNKPVLNVQVTADRSYVLQTGFYTNFASSFLAAMAELPREAAFEPLTLRVEQTPGKNSYPTTFCQLEWRGKRVERVSDSNLNKDRLARIQDRFGFKNPLEVEDTTEATDG